MARCQNNFFSQSWCRQNCFRILSSCEPDRQCRYWSFYIISLRQYHIFRLISSSKRGLRYADVACHCSFRFTIVNSINRVYFIFGRESDPPWSLARLSGFIPRHHTSNLYSAQNHWHLNCCRIWRVLCNDWSCLDDVLVYDLFSNLGRDPWRIPVDDTFVFCSINT